MSNTNEPRRTSRSGGRRLEQKQETPQRSRAPKRRKRSLGATVALRLFQLLGTLVLIGVVTSAFLACYAVVYIKTSVLPKTALDLDNLTINENSVIYYTDKNTGLSVELTTLVGEKNMEWVDLEDVPQDLIDAFVAVEDKTFWTHHGVNWYRTAGAVLNMFLGMKDTYGGSTITQQLIKNVTQYDDVTVTRKILEIFTALELERNYDKNDILELYLNKIYMGSGCYGVQSAAQKYFGKDVSELSLAECASLAGITNNPSLYGPNSTIRVTRYECSECGYLTNTELDVCPECHAEHSFEEVVWTAKDYNKRRQETILYLMWNPDGENGDTSYITEAEYEAAVAEKLAFVDNNAEDDDETDASDSYYSWYVDAVISEVIKDVMASTGLDKMNATQLVYSGGLSIYTPYDPDVQAAVDAVYSDISNLDYTSEKGQKLRSAMTIVDNSTGYVVAMAGDVGEKTGNRLWNYATDAYQPGSSFKPVSVYAPALDMGLITPATVLDDNPVLLGEDIWPSNDQGNYKGWMTVMTGVADSRNTIALRTLRLVTPEASFQYLTERFGFTTLVDSMEVGGEIMSDIDESPLAMGGLTKGVSTFEMAAAFATFPRNGMYTAPTTYLKIVDRNGKTLLDNMPTSEPVIKTSTAYYMNQMLTNAVQVGTGTPAKIDGMTVAGKTGTTNNKYARWFAGYTPYYTGVVWVGYQNNERITLTGTNPAVQMWKKVMVLVHENLENTSFNTDGIETVTRSICLDCGKLAVDGVCDHDVRGSRIKSFTFVRGDEPTDYCTCHVPVEICLDSPVLDANGNETGLYYPAGEFCPEESRATVYVVDRRDANGDPLREWVTDYSRIEDYTAQKIYYDSLGTCPIHDGSEPEPGVDDPPLETDPDWPFWEWPPIEWPSEWPSNEPTLPPEESSPAETDEPTVPPEPAGSDTPEPPVQDPGEASIPPVPED